MTANTATLPLLTSHMKVPGLLWHSWSHPPLFTCNMPRVSRVLQGHVSRVSPRVTLPRTHPRRHTCGRPRTGCSRGGSRSAAPLLQASRVTCHVSARVMCPLTLEVAELLARRVRALLAPHPPGLRRRRHAPRHLPLPGGLHMEHCSREHCSREHCSTAALDPPAGRIVMISWGPAACSPPRSCTPPRRGAAGCPSSGRCPADRAGCPGLGTAAFTCPAPPAAHLRRRSPCRTCPGRAGPARAGRRTQT